MGRLIGSSLVLVVVFVFVAQVGWAAEPGATQQAVERLRAEVPQVGLYEWGSRITRVYGRPLAFGACAEDSAELFRLGHAEVFGVRAD